MGRRQEDDERGSYLSRRERLADRLGNWPLLRLLTCSSWFRLTLPLARDYPRSLDMQMSHAAAPALNDRVEEADQVAANLPERTDDGAGRPVLSDEVRGLPEVETIRSGPHHGRTDRSDSALPGPGSLDDQHGPATRCRPAAACEQERHSASVMQTKVVR